MNYLFDTSALMDLIERKKHNILKGQYVLDLTVYEVGNIIWKMVNIFGSLNKRSAIELSKQINIIISKLNILRIENNMENILEIAVNERLTFYDASYIYFARVNNLILVTNDQKLLKKGEKMVKILKSSEI
ncbi:MAG: type II toxin-antitoxin system VapC family toxin [Candidatus Njordarchaeia archaeon]